TSRCSIGAFDRPPCPRRPPFDASPSTGTSCAPRSKPTRSWRGTCWRSWPAASATDAETVVGRVRGMTNARPDLIVVGDVMVDVTVEAGALIAEGDVHGEVRLRAGGGGANAAVWAAHRGAQVRLYGRVGD